MAAEGSRPNEVLDGSIESLLSFAQKEYEVFKSKLVKKALNYARKENGKKRLFGVPVIEHLIWTAMILASLFKKSKRMVASGLLLLLHESLCDTEQRYEDLKKKFGRKVAKLVRDVSKLGKLSKISRKEQLGNSELLPDLILAMVHGRAVTIKIVERTVQMIALHIMNPAEKKRFVNETLRAYVPLSERLNFSRLKSELQNLSFEASDELKELYASVSEKDNDGKAFKDKLECALKISFKDLPFKVKYRKKSLESIDKKMSEKKCRFSEIRDILGLRIILETEDDCSKEKEKVLCLEAKAVVQELWKMVPEFEKHYIDEPKDRYRSLHLTVKNGNDQFMEVQIRTKQMHKESEESHWAYKEPNLQEEVKKLVERARGEVKGNSSLHLPERSCAKLYVFIEDKNNKVTIEEHSTGMQLKDLCRLKGLKRRLKIRVLVNKLHASQNYSLKVGDIIKLPISLETDSSAVPSAAT